MLDLPTHTSSQGLLKRRKMEAMGLLLKAEQTDFLGTYSTGNATAITSVQRSHLRALIGKR
jgi:hypothetical protein